MSINIKEDQDVVVKQISFKTFWRTLTSIKMPWLVLIGTIAISMLNSRVSIIFPDYQQKYFEKGHLTQHTVMVGIGILLASGAVSIVSYALKTYVLSDIICRYREKIWEKCVNLSIPSLEKLNPNELISRTSADTSNLGEFLFTITITTITALYATYTKLSLISSYNKKLVYCQLVLIPFLLILRILEGRIDYKIQYRLKYRLSRLTEYLAEILINVPLIKSYVKEKEKLDKGAQAIESYNDELFRMERVSYIFAVLDYLLLLAARVFAIFYGVYLIHRGELKLATWISYFMISQMLYRNLNQILSQWTFLKDAQSSVARVSEILALDEEAVGKKQAPADLPIRVSDLEVQLGGRNVLEGINVEISPKGKTAIVGPSGSGKSSFLNSLLGFYPISKGKIQLDQTDIGDLDLDRYRECFAYVPQKVEIFSDSLRFNLTYGVHHEVDDQELLDVIHQVDLDEFFNKLSDGLDSQMAEAGRNASGGERQKLALARAILQLKDPERKLLLLDEATSHLDPESEATINGVIDDLAETYPVVMVSHHLKSVVNAESIIVLDKGKLVQTGKHQDLLTNCNLYAKLVAEEWGA
ncbi:ABC transporter ATP-binding protein [Atopobacter sp. AH10]|uniref:ABC transporter ATP-binding protein n=1 Tax=Atopobacter sp. AH10 TaxID=2315861 RepID=UPI000EF187AE|nr:ABC transporter ATP-binding protein [Atopobacter sp. AH10]RLK63944.1 ABC transporter ATP-binding protein [Atopobacter sp. AH10]